jgi:uncharacterized membrane protein
MGLALAGAIALSPYLVWYSQEARSYSLGVRSAGALLVV